MYTSAARLAPLYLMGWIYCLVPKLATKTVCPRFSTVCYKESNGILFPVTPVLTRRLSVAWSAGCWWYPQLEITWCQLLDGGNSAGLRGWQMPPVMLSTNIVQYCFLWQSPPIFSAFPQTVFFSQISRWHKWQKLSRWRRLQIFTALWEYDWGRMEDTFSLQ